MTLTAIRSCATSKQTCIHNFLTENVLYHPIDVKCKGLDTVTNQSNIQPRLSLKIQSTSERKPLTDTDKHDSKTRGSIYDAADKLQSGPRSIHQLLRRKRFVIYKEASNSTRPGESKLQGMPIKPTANYLNKGEPSKQLQYRVGKVIRSPKIRSEVTQVVRESFGSRFLRRIRHFNAKKKHFFTSKSSIKHYMYRHHRRKNGSRYNSLFGRGYRDLPVTVNIRHHRYHEKKHSFTHSLAFEGGILS